MQLFSEFLWEKNAREINEDSLAINQVVMGGKPLLMAVVCDGIGSLPQGETASSFVVARMKKMFDDIDRNRQPKMRRLRHGIGRQLYYCHEQMAKLGYGTTISMLIIYDRRAMVISLGDSRIYAGYKGKRLKQITTDTCDGKGRLTCAVGVGPYVGFKEKIMRIEAGSIFLLCTDGFYRRNDRNIREQSYNGLHNEEDWRIKLEEMYRYAVEHGEKDNATGIVVIVSPERKMTWMK
ncbi:MAG: protein phosphatase 2C domain-containing protein [Lachnospiraceae bacterium]|nr:protein phosphatase 2C domain-containing protein [Lachnospiraceae bacterium]